MDKIISIIIPSYNMERYLPQCLDSLLIPNLDKVEILVVNDGSKDRTSEIAHEYESRFPMSIRVIDKLNGNYGSCINKGLKEATGKYVKVLDADDSFDNGNFNEFVEFLTSTDVDLIISDYNIVDEFGNITEHVTFDLLKGLDEIRFDSRFLNLDFSRLQMHGITYRLENLKTIDYTQTEGISYTDQEWIFLPMVKVKKYKYFGKTVYRYLVGREGQTVGASNKKHFLTLIGIMHGELESLSDLKNHHDIDAVHLNYLMKRLYMLFCNIAYTTFMYDNDKEIVKALYDFDRSVERLFPELYLKLSYVRLKPNIPFRYIAHWRRNGYDSDTYLFRLFRMALTIWKR